MANCILYDTQFMRAHSPFVHYIIIAARRYYTLHPIQHNTGVCKHMFFMNINDDLNLVQFIVNILWTIL